MTILKKRVLISALMGFGASAVSAEAHRPATLEELNGMTHVENCSGTFVSLGRKDSSRALILSAGHCPSYPTFYKQGVAEGGTDYSKEPPAKSFPPGSTLEAPLNYPIRQLYYATMTTSDISLYELASSIEKLKNQKLKILELADYLPKPGKSYSITSGYWKETQTCEVESILADNDSERSAVGFEVETYPFRNSILFKAPCFARGGWSGSPIYDAETNLVYGVLSRIYESNPTPALTRFAEFISKKWNPFNPETETEVRVIASNVIDLKDCLASDGAIDTKRTHCDLPKPTMKPSPVPHTVPRPRPTSSWPKNVRIKR